MAAPLDPYARWYRAGQPPWLQGPYGRMWSEAFGLLWDMVADAARKAVLARLVPSAPVDALPYIAADRMIEALDSEGQSVLRSSLAQAFGIWEYAGTRQGMIDALSRIGYDNVRIYTYFDRPDGRPDEWARFSVHVGQPHPFTSPRRIGDGWKIGDGTLIGITGATHAQVEQLKRAVRQWKPAFAKCEGIYIQISGRAIGDGWAIGDGTVIGGEQIRIGI